ncbi:MAG TPA: sulfatase-like hydrolase/transferase [Thermoanaerobaculia bacterium]|nr:sulfatase-like hydrolase/transferase [Thermoanaerobaculia bacterium]
MTSEPNRSGGLQRFRMVVLTLLAVIGCAQEQPSSPPPEAILQPSILLITLDTTRADSIGPDAKGIATPAFNTLAKKARNFRQAYATVPQTLPSHSSMMTGLYPAAHGVHENSRFLAAHHPVVAERLRDAGYRTAAFVSAFPLARRFGLARGFEQYDDESENGRAERSSRATTDRALSWLHVKAPQPVFLWVHLFDPHEPYEPPEPFRSRYPGNPYLGEIAAMDDQLGRLVAAFENQRGRPTAIIIAGDHGESLGEHGEAEHGKLLYQGVMRVPLLVSGPRVENGTSDSPVSIRRIFHTILDWAGIQTENSLLRAGEEVVLAEAMEPFLEYGWQPQIMAVAGSQKVIQAGRLEVYDVVADPAENRDLSATADLSRPLRQALRDYPIPSLDASTDTGSVSDEDRRQLASLGYVSSDTQPVVRADAPRPRDMVHLFHELDRASILVVREEFRRAIPLLNEVLEKDPYNLAIALRLAAAHSRLGHEKEALLAFTRAESIAPDSVDVPLYLALHHSRGREWQRAGPLLERVLARTPNRLPAIEALAVVREREGRIEEALQLRVKAESMKSPAPSELIHTGELAMRAGNTALAVTAFEKARTLQGPGFRNDLELGVLYLSSKRFQDAAVALDRVKPSDPGYPMALFKRAQVSVVLREPDRISRISTARTHANEMTRRLIENERMFANVN